MSPHHAPLQKGTHEHPRHTLDRHRAHRRALVGGLKAPAPCCSGSLLVRRRSLGGPHARSRGHALATRAVAGSRRSGRGGSRASALAARSLPPLAAGDRTKRARRRTRGRRRRSSHGVRARAARARWSSQGRQRDLPLDGQPAPGDADGEPIGPQAGHRPSLVPERREQGTCSSVLRGSRPPAGRNRRHAIVHVRLLRRRRNPRHDWYSDQHRPEDVAGAAVLTGAVPPARDVHGTLRRPRQPRLRRRRVERAVRVRGLGARRRAGRRADHAPRRDGAHRRIRPSSA